MVFKKIETIEDVRPFVEDKKEIRFLRQPNGTVIGCYMFSDSKTFSSPEALECRGIAFGGDGKIISRPLHKFFNVGERSGTMKEEVLSRGVARVFEKLDGSMIATALADGRLALRSKKSFASDVVVLAWEILDSEEGKGTREFCARCAAAGITAIFELTDPRARIVVAQDKGRLRLLHARENESGEYLTLDRESIVWKWADELGVERVPELEITAEEAFGRLETMRDMEGYVFQFVCGDMVKVKCPWYLRLHRSITFLRERDIALAALEDGLDDLKGSLREAGVDLSGVEEVESRLKDRLAELEEEAEGIASRGAGMERKDFALAFSKHPLFGVAMAVWLGKDGDLAGWYKRNRLKEEFGLKVLANETLADALDG